MSASRRWRRNRLRYRAAEPTGWHWEDQVYNSGPSWKQNRILGKAAHAPWTRHCAVFPLAPFLETELEVSSHWPSGNIRRSGKSRLALGICRVRCLPRKILYIQQPQPGMFPETCGATPASLKAEKERPCVLPLRQQLLSQEEDRRVARAVGKGSWGPFKQHKRASRQAGRLKHTALFNKTADRPSLAPPRSPC